MDKCRKESVTAYMTVEAALVMFVVFMVYLFVIENMLMQYNRCIEELEGARQVVQRIENEDNMYEVMEVNPVSFLRLQRLITSE